MTDEIELWGEINNDLTNYGSLSECNVNVYKLTSYLEQLYSKIEALERELEYQKEYADEVEVAEPSIPSMINCIIRGNPPNGCSSWNEWFELFGSKGILHNLNISAKEYQPPEPTTLYDALRKLDKPMFIDDVLGAVENWLPKEHDTNSDGWNKCVRMLRENLR
jgi:hypothetical protein